MIISFTSRTWAVSLVAMFILPSLAFAGPVVRSGENVSIDADQILEDDFYGAGASVSISGEAEHDVYIVGGKVTTNSTISEDLVVVGGTVQVHGVVEDDLRVLGGEVTIADDVQGDVAVLGGTVHILSTATVGGDVLFLGELVDISGDVDGSVFGYADTVRIDAAIGGDVDVAAYAQLSLGSRAEVAGNVQYTSKVDVARAQEAVVIGDINKKDVEEDAAGPSNMSLVPLLMLLFAALTIFLLRKSYLQKVVDITKHSYGTQGLIGLAVLLVIPAVSVLLMVSVIGMIPGLVLLLSYVIMLLLTWVVSGAVVGTFIARYVTKNNEVTMLTVILGIILLQVLMFVPVVGQIVALLVFLVTLGGCAKILYNSVR